MSRMMRAAIFVEAGRIELADKPIPSVGPNYARAAKSVCGG